MRGLVKPQQLRLARWLLSYQMHVLEILDRRYRLSANVFSFEEILWVAKRAKCRNLLNALAPAELR